MARKPTVEQALTRLGKNDPESYELKLRVGRTGKAVWRCNCLSGPCAVESPSPLRAIAGVAEILIDNSCDDDGSLAALVADIKGQG